MELFDSAAFKLAWARIVARSAVDSAFKTRVSEDPVVVFAEHGVTDQPEADLKEFVAAHLQAALAVIELQTERQRQPDRAVPQGQTMFGQSMTCFPCSGDTATQACRIPCWAPQSNATSGIGSRGAGRSDLSTIATTVCYCGGVCACVGSGPVATQATSPPMAAQSALLAMPCWGSTDSGMSFNGRGTVGMTGGNMMSTQLSSATGGMATAGSDMGRSFNCWGTAATLGSAGSFCGTAGTAGTGGTFGCGGGLINQPQMVNANMGGATAGGGTSGTMAGRSFNCLGSIGTAASFGSFCGTAGSAGTVGCFGSAVQQQMNMMSNAAATIGGSGAMSTQLSGATGGMATSGMATGGMTTAGSDMGRSFNCWGTAATLGSAGSFCGTAGTAGTGGTFGCGGGLINQPQMVNANMGGATAGGGTAAGGGTSGTMAGRGFNCLGSIGTAASFGSVCGTAGSAGTVGCFGSAVQQPMNMMSNAAATMGGSGAMSTQLSGATGGMATAGSDMGWSLNCWGTAATQGSTGSFCGTAGTVGPGGNFGCSGDVAAQDSANSGATLGSFATYCGCVGGGGGGSGTNITVCWGTITGCF